MKHRKSSVNFRNLIRDLAEMYPFEVSEVVLTELIANSLDAKATSIEIEYNSKSGILSVADDGGGMVNSQFEEYHDFAAGLKTKGSGIGFAGVGAKISFNAARRVQTETKSRRFEGSSDWYFNGKGELVWDFVESSTLTKTGTKVVVHFNDPAKVNFRTSDDIRTLLKKHFLPLFDVRFRSLYKKLGFYEELEFIVNKERIEPYRIEDQFNLSRTKEFFPQRLGKKIGYGILGLSKDEYPLGLDRAGVLLCTYGKVIRSDSFNMFPGAVGPKVFGLVEVRDLVDFLTTAKTDFNKGRGPTYKKFLSLYEPIKEQYGIWLGELGVVSQESSSSSETVRLEQRLRELIVEFPELSEFFGLRMPKSVLAADDSGTATGEPSDGFEITYPLGSGSGLTGNGPTDIGDLPGLSFRENSDQIGEKVRSITRTAKKGPKVSFADVPERPELGWVDGNCIMINVGHDAYKSVANNSSAKHLYQILAISTGLMKFFGATDTQTDLTFIDRFVTAWAKK